MGLLALRCPSKRIEYEREPASPRRHYEIRYVVRPHGRRGKPYSWEKAESPYSVLGN